VGRGVRGDVQAAQGYTQPQIAMIRSGDRIPTGTGANRRRLKREEVDL